jgi:hypothetical protein
MSPAAIETVAGFLSDANAATAQAFTAATTQSFNVRAASPNSGISMQALWAPFQDAGDIRIRSPRMHDDVNGLRYAAPVALSDLVAEEDWSEPLYSQDTLIVEGVFTVAPTAGHISTVFMQIYYDDLPGIQGNFKHWAEIESKVQSHLVVPVTATTAAAATAWGTGVAINSTVDVFKANSWYAWLGYIMPVQCGAVSMLGTDLGNLMVGGPGSTKAIETRNFFARMEEWSGKASIPVINSQNKGATLVQVADIATAVAHEVSLIFAYLGPVS